MAVTSGADPPFLYPDYQSTRLRAPGRPLVSGVPDMAGPRFEGAVDDDDLTRRGPLGERIIVTGTVLGADGRPVPGALVELWQANAAGRYDHPVDDHPAPLDPNFHGAGRCLTDEAGRYRFVTVKPGAYPWKNHHNAWRPAHVHFSVFGRTFAERLVTQMYFPADPLFPYDPIFQSVAAAGARDRLVTTFDPDVTEPDWALGYRWDIALPGHAAPTPSQTIGPFFAVALGQIGVVDDGVVVAGRVLDGAGDPVGDALLEVWDPAAQRFGRCPTDESGGYRFTVLADRTVWISIFARGLLSRLVTRIDIGDGPVQRDINLQADQFLAV
jgi:protocatechuate 3,4-dioxygenase beta subunit